MRHTLMSYKFSNPDLISLACVSKPISELALDALWLSLNGIDPIIGLLPCLSPIYGKLGISVVSAQYFNFCDQKRAHSDLFHCLDP